MKISRLLISLDEPTDTDRGMDTPIHVLADRTYIDFKDKILRARL